MSRFLLLEDEPLIAAMLADWLAQQGHTVEALAHTNSSALDLIDLTSVDAAILDIQVSDGTAYPVATKLRQRNIPFLFATGWTVDAIDAEFQHELIARKPFEFETLDQQLRALLSNRAIKVSGKPPYLGDAAPLT
jgi:DNA-binding response OmpR family regulator